VPAWCDRVLYWVRDKNVKLEQSAYTSSDSVMFSDHKPVISSFRLSVKTIDKQRKLVVYDEMLKDSDRKANNLLPQVSLSQTEVHFGSVAFGYAAISKLTIKNTGLSSTRFHFSSQHQTLKDTDISENWLNVTPKSSFIEIGGEVLVTLQACVKNEEAMKIKTRTSISCILILSLDQGRDYFIVVTATYMPPTLATNDSTNEPAKLLATNPGEDNEQWLIDFGDTPGTSAK